MYSEALNKKTMEDRIVLGGCCNTLDNPIWECIKCAQRIYKELSEDLRMLIEE